ncbi:hypothetical protein [Jongsikchunia kroppenstedtii]|uniref:hypothetical protein n=1 Tax=Jongsikchunia kroppenstedtii TaxID=1121721 RepID=UPI0003A5DE02|nr:hypothetical protein [Jongsikchunia kroppenstedtii]
MKRNTMVMAVVAGAAALTLAACGDSSTASGPTTTKTSMSTTTPPNMTGNPTESTATNPTTSPGLPSTAPNASGTVPEGFPGGTSPQSAPTDPKTKALLDELHKQNVGLDDTLAPGLAQYVCQAQGKMPPDQMRTFVLAVVGSGMTGQDAAANAKADKFIQIAKSTYC